MVSNDYHYWSGSYFQEEEQLINYAYDDSRAEIYVGSAGSIIVVASRFVVNEPVNLNSVAFYTSVLAAGQPVEVIIYEDSTGIAQVPHPSLEILRLPAILQACPVVDFLINKSTVASSNKKIYF